MTTEYTRQAETAQRASAAVHEPGMKINRHIHARAQHLLAADFAQRAGLAKEATAHKKAASDHAKAVKSLSTTMKRFRHGMTDFEAGAADLAALQFASKAKTGDYVRMLNSKTGEKVHGVFVNKRGYGIGVFHPSRMKNTIPGSEVTLPENLGEDPGYSWEKVRHEINKKSTDTQRKARITKLKKAGALSPESPENFEACSLDLATLQFASGENPRKPKNLMYGYFGTARLHLGNDVAAHVDFAKARLALQHHYGMSPRRARTLLDTRYGRHLADRVHGDKLSHAEAVHHLGHPKHWDSRFAEGTF